MGKVEKCKDSAQSECVVSYFKLKLWSSKHLHTLPPPPLSTRLPCHRRRHSFCAVACAALAWHILVWIFNGFAVKLMSQRRSKVKQSRVVDGAGFAQFALAQQEQEVAWGQGGVRGGGGFALYSHSARLLWGPTYCRRFATWKAIRFSLANY